MEKRYTTLVTSGLRWTRVWIIDVYIRCFVPSGIFFWKNTLYNPVEMQSTTGLGLFTVVLVFILVSISFIGIIVDGEFSLKSGTDTRL